VRAESQKGDLTFFPIDYLGKRRKREEKREKGLDWVKPGSTLPGFDC
jgi:hypothetical protein